MACIKTHSCPRFERTDERTPPSLERTPPSLRDGRAAGLGRAAQCKRRAAPGKCTTGNGLRKRTWLQKHTGERMHQPSPAVSRRPSQWEGLDFDWTRWRLGLAWIFAFCVSLLMGSTSNLVHAQEERSPTVGAAGHIEQIVLPGTELVGKPLNQGDPIVVRVLKSFPHGDSFRYDLRFHGMEPGKYDLAKWLRRKDGTGTDDLPKISVEVTSLLPPGQIEPNELETGWIPALGGYRNVAIAIATLWGLGLLGLVFLGRKKKQALIQSKKKITLADLLQSRIEKALGNQMKPEQYAELERMLFAFWQKRLGLADLPAHEAMAKIKNDKDAGPLMRQIEQWMHSPKPETNVDLPALLKPFRDLPADTPGFEA